MSDNPGKKVRVLGIIPARGGSTRIKRKNIVDVAGKPLIYYSIREAQKSKLIDAFIVSTDDDEIAEVARSFGADVPFKRPKRTARKFSAEIEYQQHALNWLKKHRGWEPELVVMIKPTSPLRPASVIDEVVEFALKHPHYSFVTTVCPPPFHPYRMSQFGDDGKTMNLILPDMVRDEDFAVWGGYVPTQKLAPVVAHNTLVDAIPAHCIHEGTHAVFRGPIGGVHTDPLLSVDIDGPEELEIVRVLVEKNERERQQQIESTRKAPEKGTKKSKTKKKSK